MGYDTPQKHGGMDARCLCTPPLRPFANTSSALHGDVSNLSSPNPREQPSLPCQSCRCRCQAAGCHHNQNCMQPLSENWAHPTHQSPCLIHRSQAAAPKSHHAIDFDRCIHVHPWRPAAQAEECGTLPVTATWAAFSKEPTQGTTDLTEHQPILGNGAVYSLDSRGLGPTSQHGYCTPCLPMHYAVYSSPVSMSCSPKERGHRFSNNVAPVLVAVHHPKEQGSPPYVEQLPQIDRSPTPSVPASCSTFSGACLEGNLIADTPSAH